MTKYACLLAVLAIGCSSNDSEANSPTDAGNADQHTSSGGTGGTTNTDSGGGGSGGTTGTGSAMPLISRDVPAFAAEGDPAAANDDAPNTAWGAPLPASIAYDL